MSLAFDPRPDSLWEEPPPPAAEGDAQVRPTPVAIRRRIERRGPLRPGRLISTRERLNGETLALGYRIADALLIAALAWFSCDVANPAGLWAAPVRSALPFLGSGLLLGFCLYATGAQDFRARETLVTHLARVSGGFAMTLLFALPVLALNRTGAAIWQALGVGFCLAFASLYLLHMWQWLSVRRMRRSGRLTPNVVVVGATHNAERLIERALASRELAVLGVFDDRRGRAPDAIKGVPVLGDTRTLVGHRIMPYVDRIVITVTAAAQARVRTLVDKLNVLPNEITLFLDLGTDDAQTAVLSRLADLPLARMSGGRHDVRRAVVKRLQDIVVGAAALVVGLPLMAIVAMAIKLDSPGPVFFRQKRQGFNNEEIVVWKFRSMHHDMRDELAVQQVSNDDPRVTS